LATVSARPEPVGAAAEPDVESEEGQAPAPSSGLSGRLAALPAAFVRTLAEAGLSSLTRRILVLNIFALLALVGGILYLNQFRAGLIDARVDSLLTQGQIIATAIAAQAIDETDAITIDPDKLLEIQAGESVSPIDIGEGAADFPINPVKVAPLLDRLVSPTGTTARIYDQEGTLLLDSRMLYARGQILRFDLPPPDAEGPSLIEAWWNRLRLWYRSSDLPPYREIGAESGREYPEVARALSGTVASNVRVDEDGGMIVLVAVPIQRFRAVLGALLLSTESGDIDAIVAGERMAIFRVFLVAAGVTVLLSVLLASTIAGPVRRLANAAERVQRGKTRRLVLPDFGARRDEIGHLARALKAMMATLGNRMEATERFAADVAHELKNPLTSLRSAVETLPIARTEEARSRLLEVIKHDVNRLDRLISDISDASRLDAEMAREEYAPVDLKEMIETIAAVARETHGAGGPDIQLVLEAGAPGRPALLVYGHDGRLAQVVANLIDNAVSFVDRKKGWVRIKGRRLGDRVVIVVDDNGPGIRAERIERIFERFYTDRPEGEGFGNNSGLGLAIVKQIVEAHNGTIRAENRLSPAGVPRGARFTVTLPAASPESEG